MFRGLSVYTGNAHPKFARDICSHLEIQPGAIDVFKFANDNIFVQIKENAREHDVFLVQSLVGPSVSDAIMASVLSSVLIAKCVSVPTEKSAPARAARTRNSRWGTS